MLKNASFHVPWLKNCVDAPVICGTMSNGFFQDCPSPKWNPNSPFRKALCKSVKVWRDQRTERGRRMRTGWQAKSIKEGVGVEEGPQNGEQPASTNLHCRGGCEPRCLFLCWRFRATAEGHLLLIGCSDDVGAETFVYGRLRRNWKVRKVVQMDSWC